MLKPLVARFEELDSEEQNTFRAKLTDYVRLYAFLSQVLTFADAELEKLYQLARFLRRYLPKPPTELPREIQEQIDIESFRVQKTSSGKLTLPRGTGVLDPIQEKTPTGKDDEHVDPLSEILRRLNERFGANLTEEDRVTLRHVAQKLEEDNALDASARVNTRENVRLTFDHKFNDIFQDIINSNFDLYRRATDDESFGTALKDYLFDQYLRRHREVKELIARGESKTLEFKSTLRWNLKENRKDRQQVTHAVLKTIAAFLNTEGGDLIIGVNDAGEVVGIELDQFDSSDKFMLHLAQVVRNGLGDRASTCIDPRVQKLNGNSVCLVTCQRSPEPVFLKWSGVTPDAPEGDFYVRSGPGTVKLSPDSAKKYISTRFRRDFREDQPGAEHSISEPISDVDGAAAYVLRQFGRDSKWSEINSGIWRAISATEARTITLPEVDEIAKLAATDADDVWPSCRYYLDQTRVSLRCATKKLSALTLRWCSVKTWSNG